MPGARSNQARSKLLCLSESVLLENVIQQIRRNVR